MIDWESSYRERFARICEEWDRAEVDIKLAEQVCHKVVFPSIKELRYAGRRVVEALNKVNGGDADNSIDNLLQDAEFDCHRARHDAIDAATAKIALDIEIAAKKLGYDAVLKAFPDFPKINSTLNIIREKIKESRGNRENREAIYSVIEATDFEEIVGQFRKFQAQESVMRGIAKKQRFHLFIGYSIGIVGLILATISLIVAVS